MGAVMLILVSNINTTCWFPFSRVPPWQKVYKEHFVIHFSRMSLATCLGLESDILPEEGRLWRTNSFICNYCFRWAVTHELLYTHHNESRPTVTPWTMKEKNVFLWFAVKSVLKWYGFSQEMYEKKFAKSYRRNLGRHL